MPSHRPQPKYDPADFIIPAQDAKGHSERVYASIQPGDSRSLDIIRESRRFPFRTKGDIIRWAIHQGIKQLEAMEDVPSVSAQVDMIAALVREEQFNSEYEHTFDQMAGVINRHMSNGAYGEVRRVIAHARAMMDRMPDGYWKDRYLGTLDDRFERQLEAAEALSDEADGGRDGGRAGKKAKGKAKGGTGSSEVAPAGYRVDGVNGHTVKRKPGPQPVPFLPRVRKDEGEDTDEHDQDDE